MMVDSCKDLMWVILISWLISHVKNLMSPVTETSMSLVTCDLGSFLFLVNPVLLILLILLLKVIQVANVCLFHAHQAGQALHVLVPGR